jgi:hypothetical protein
MSTSSMSVRRSPSLVNTAAMIVGVVFVLVGILGFVPGITTHYGDLAFMGHGSGAKLLGVFQVSILHNLVHLLFGVAGIAAGRATSSAARGYLVGGGVIYLVLWIYGLVIGMGSSANFVPVNDADNWLHLLLGIGMIALGLALGRTATSTATR